MHRDLKFVNIDFFNISHFFVLLNFDTFRHILTRNFLRFKFDTIDTLNYLISKFELQNYDHSIDIWIMIIILYELTYDYHSWKFVFNSWRDDKNNEKLRSFFQKKYQDVIIKMKINCKTHESSTNDYIHCECSLRNACFESIINEINWSKVSSQWTIFSLK